MKMNLKVKISYEFWWEQKKIFFKCPIKPIKILLKELVKVK